MYKSQNSSGFTLIELLIVISIISIMSAASIPGFRGFIRGQNVKQSMEQVKSDLRSVQTKAMVGTLSDETDVSYWGITFVAGQSNYKNYTFNSLFSSGVLQGISENLVGDAVIRQNRTIYFQIPSGDAYYFSGTSHPKCNDASGTAATCTVIVGPVTGSNCSRIRINSAGALFKEEGVVCP
jgi:prepilin-type N-terminal cleavage/methylation domain-containing protein